MGIEEVRIGTTVGISSGRTVIGQQMKHVADDAESMVAIKHTGPEVDFPSQTPTRCHIATLLQGGAGGGKQLRMAIRGYLVRRIQSIQMRDVAVLVVWIVTVLLPLLQLPILAHLHGRKLLDGCRQTLLVSGIGLHDVRSLLRGGQHVKHNLVVHRRAGCQRCPCTHRTVFGRYRRNGHQRPCTRIGLQIVKQEIGGSFQHGIHLRQELLVARIEVMLPDVRRQPRASGGEHSPLRTVNGTGNTPQVGVVVGHPSAAVVELAGRCGSRDAQVLHHREEWHLRFCQVGDVGRPIVHLGIDVDGVFAVPRGILLVVPDALQIGRLTSWLRRGDEQIAAILEHQRHQVDIGNGIFVLGELFHALVSLQLRCLADGQCEAHAGKLVPVGGNMTFQQLGIFQSGSTCQDRFVLRMCIPAHIVIIHEIRGRSDADGSSCGSFHNNLALTTLHTTVTLHLHAALGLQACLHAFLVDTVDYSRQRSALGTYIVVELALKTERELQRAFLVGLNPDNHHAIGNRGKHRAPIAHTVRTISRCSRSILQIQVAVIIVHLSHLRERQHGIAQRQVTHTMRSHHEMLGSRPLGKHLIACKNAVAHSLQIGQRMIRIIIVRTARPEGLVVQRNHLAGRSAKYHTSHPAVANRQRFQPTLCRGGIPQLAVLGMSHINSCHKHEQQHYKFLLHIV